ncbi:glycoside hydrolase, partial [Mycena crocata]
TADVRFDSYSLILKGQRVFLHSGEFHTWRLPVPSLWPDILEKTKAAGLNAISIYTHMGLLNPSRGAVDLDGFRALKPLYETAMAAGIWVVVRPGPYINAETSAGGIAHWVTTEVAGQLRTNDSDWSAAWQDYIQAIIKETVPYQINEGGPVIGGFVSAFVYNPES